MTYVVRFDPNGPVTHQSADAAALAVDVIKEDVAFPMVFSPVSNGNIVGYFFAPGSDEPCATMYIE